MGQSAKAPANKNAGRAAKAELTPHEIRARVREFSDYSTIGLFALASIAALRLADFLFVPIVAAVVVGVILARVGDRAQRIGVPPAVTAIALVGLTAAVLLLIGQALSSPISTLIDRLPDLATRLTGALHRAAAHVLPASALPGRDGAGPGFDMGWVTGLFSGLTPALGELLIFLATLFFFVTGRTELRKRAILASDDRDRRLSVLRMINATEGALAEYFGTAAAIYAAIGALTALIAWVAGLGTPALWGVFTFVVCFIPFLGVTVTTAALISAALMVYDSPALALLPGAIFLAAHLIAENAILPSLVGRRFEINPFLIFISIVFWTWMWGATGAVLAAPLLLAARTIHAELSES